jgi:hypothetical protein
VMEPARPLVDQWVLRFLERHRFKALDFADTRRGTCRISPLVTHYLAETTNEWASAVRPHAEEVASFLSAISVDTMARVPTPPSDIAVAATPVRRTQSTPSAQPSHCQRCGGTVRRQRTHCDGCLAQLRDDLPGKAHAHLDLLRNQGEDPAHGGEAASKRARAVAANNRKSYEWNRTHSRLDPATFTEQILPHLQDVTLAAMSEATGLSKGYCSFIKRGLKVPHERHWDALYQLPRESDA